MLPLLLLLVAAHPKSSPLLEPNPGPDAHRLHPRRVTASSFLKNGWNRFEQNYLPPYVADDDPATAWVEGVPGAGVGESLVWVGPRLQAARQYRVFIRNGYQKSKRLYLANGRPRRVRLEPVVQTEAGWSATGTPVEVELAYKVGWQEVQVPTPPKVTGLRLTILSVYSGSTYEDTCISDLRVYVEGNDPYRPDMEAQAREEIRRFVLERQRAEARGSHQSAVEVSAEYERASLWSHPLKGGVDPKTALELVANQATFAPALARAKALLDEIEKPPSDRKVSLNSRYPTGQTAAVALAAMSSLDFAETLSFAHLRDVVLYDFVDHPASPNAEEDSDKETQEAYVRGDLATPQALLLTEHAYLRHLVDSREGRDEVVRDEYTKERLLIFKDEVAVGVAIRVNAPPITSSLELDIPEWKKLPDGRVHLAAVYVFELGPNTLKAAVYREKT